MADAATHLAEQMTVEAFLAFVDDQPPGQTWELLDGVPHMMTGGTVAHAVIIGNLFGPLDRLARQRGCRALNSLLVQAPGDNAFEPDLMVRCGPIDSLARSAPDPLIVVEVLSKSTMRHDRVLKFERYRTLPSLRQIVFVYQDLMRAESWLREAGDWLREPVLLTGGEAVLAFPSLGGSLSLNEIYEGVTPSPLND